MHTVFALLCFVVVIHWLIFPYPSGLLHWHCGNLTIAPVPEKQPWWIWINTSCIFIMNDCITTTQQSTTKPCAYFLGYTVRQMWLIIPAFTPVRPWWSKALGQPHEATVVKMAPTRPLASRSFCLLAPLRDHRSLSNLQQRSTEAWFTLYQNDKLVPFLVFVQ